MPLLAPLLLPLLVILAALFLLAANETSKSWLEPLIASLQTPRGGFFTRIVTLPARALVALAASAFSAVSHAMSVAASHRLGALAHWLDALTARLAMLRHGTVSHAEAIAHGFERLTTHTLPRAIGRETRPINARAKKAAKAAAAAGLLGAALARRFAHVIGHEIRPELHRLRHEATVALPRAIGRIGARERTLERYIREKVDPRLRRLAKLTGAGYLLGLILRTLARRFPWLFCRKVNTLGKRACGLPDDLMQALLLGTIALNGTVSVREFIRDAQAVEREALEALHLFIREL